MIYYHEDGRATTFGSEPPHVPCPPEPGSPLYERLRGPINVAAAQEQGDPVSQPRTGTATIEWNASNAFASSAAPDTHDFREYRERDRPDWDLDTCGNPLRPGS